MRKRNDWVAPILKLLGIVSIAVSLLANQWFAADSISSRIKTTMIGFSIASIVAIVLAMIVDTWKTAGLAVMCCIATFALATVYVFAGTDRHTFAGPSYTLILVGLAIAISGIGFEPIRRSASELDERGETVDGKRVGRWHVYKNDRVVEIREYEDGKLVTSKPVA